MNEVPMPPSGKAKILYSIADKEIIFTRPPVNRPIENIDLPYDKAFQCISAKTALGFFHCLLLDQKILMHSSQLSILTSVAECMISFMYPFSWEHVYIPVLPKALVGVIHAPMPFIAGVNSAWMEQLREDIPDTVVVLDIDNDIILIPDSVHLTALPEKEEQKLLLSLQEIAEPVKLRRGGGDEDVWRMTTLSSMDSAYSFAACPQDFDDNQTVNNQDWHKLRLAFLRFFVSSLRDYGKFVKSKSLVQNKKKKEATVSQKEFLVDEFLRAQKDSSRAFLQTFCSTLSFTKFMDDCIRVNQEEENYDVTFFNESINEKKNRSFLTFRKLATPFLQSVKHDVQKTVVCFAPDKAGLPVPNPGVDLPRFRYPHGFPALDESMYIDPRPLPAIPVDPKRAFASARKKIAGFWLTQGGESQLLGFYSTVYCVWFLTVAAITMPTGKDEEGSEKHIGFGLSNSDKDTTRNYAAKRRRQKLRRLGAAFDILERMKRDMIERDELIYRSLIDASGRCGSTHHAVLVLRHMKEDGIQPDSLFFSCLASAFSMDTALPTLGALPDGLMDAWEDNMKGGDSKSAASSPSRNSVKRESSFGAIFRLGGGGGSNNQKMNGAEELKMKDRNLNVVTESTCTDDCTPVKRKQEDLEISIPHESESAAKEIVALNSAMISPRGTGYRLLETVFPTLEIDTDRETCPKCNLPHSLADVWAGFSVKDPNDYTTLCRDPKCGRRFVARFTVFSSAEDWMGTVGPKKPLFFEALSSWVLQKEVRTILINSGGVALTSAESFRSSSPTIYWNLILYFREFSLPLDFLVLQEELEDFRRRVQKIVGEGNVADLSQVGLTMVGFSGRPNISGFETHSTLSEPLIKDLEEADHRLHSIMSQIGPNWRFQMQGSPEVAAVEAANKARVALDAVLGKAHSVPHEELRSEINRAIAHVEVAEAVQRAAIEASLDDAAVQAAAIEKNDGFNNLEIETEHCVYEETL
jgi:pentatricopeptide repeat protein